MQEDRIAQYKKLIKEKGIDEAIKIMQSTNLSNDNFTESHKSDPAFSDAESDKISQTTQEIPVEVKLSFANNQELDWITETDEFYIDHKMSEQIVPQIKSKMKLSNSILTV